MDEKLLNDFEALRNQIKLYGEEFDVVLIAELFDESLIVLKDFLCWNVEDILFLKVGTRVYFSRDYIFCRGDRYVLAYICAKNLNLII